MIFFCMECLEWLRTPHTVGAFRLAEWHTNDIVLGLLMSWGLVTL